MSIKLNAFITMYKIRKTDEEKLEFIKEHVKSDYIPFEKKADVAKAIVQVSYYVNEKDINDNDVKKFYVDSVAKYMLTCMSIIDLYTDIERNKKEGKILEDFNVLNEYGIFDVLIQNIQPRELKEFNMIIQMTVDDLLTNEYEAHSFIRNQVERFGSLIGASIKPFIDQFDENTIKDLLSQINKPQG